MAKFSENGTPQRSIVNPGYPDYNYLDNCHLDNCVWVLAAHRLKTMVLRYYYFNIVQQKWV